MRYTSIVLLALVASALPAFAQDRTPPAGSYLALQAPIDLQQAPAAVIEPNRGLYEGRSIGDRKMSPKRHHGVVH